jgi:hypothetical protein
MKDKTYYTIKIKTKTSGDWGINQNGAMYPHRTCTYKVFTSEENAHNHMRNFYPNHDYEIKPLN